jgi:acyl carrier protein
MATALEQLKQQAVTQYDADASEVENMSTEDLTNLVLRKFAEREYKVDAGETEGKSNQEMIETLVRSMVSDVLKKDASEITPQTSFKDLGADSLDMVELLMRIEDVVRLFGDTKIADEDAEIDTVGEAVQKIDEYINKSVAA